jgi:Rieske Fe-S protein
MDNLNRRQFLKKSVLTVAVTSTCLCNLNGCASITKIGNTPAIHPESFTLADNILTIDLSNEATLSKVGGAVKVRHFDIPDGLIIAHVEENRYEIASILCTHRGVEVEYDHSQTSFECASLGGSAYTIDGDNVGGPAEKPLKNYGATLKNRILTIKI